MQKRLKAGDRLRVGRGTARVEDAQGTPTQSHISPSMLVYEDKPGCFPSMLEYEDKLGYFHVEDPQTSRRPETGGEHQHRMLIRQVGTLLVFLLLFCFVTLVTGPRRSMSLKLSDTRVYEPQIRAVPISAAHTGW